MRSPNSSKRMAGVMLAIALFLALLYMGGDRDPLAQLDRLVPGDEAGTSIEVLAAPSLARPSPASATDPAARREALRSQGSLRGRVLSEARPVPNARVTILCRKGRRTGKRGESQLSSLGYGVNYDETGELLSRHSTKTEPDGSFLFDPLDSGKYAILITVGREGFSGRRRRVDSSTGSTHFQYSLAAGQDLDVGDLDLPDGSWEVSQRNAKVQVNKSATLHIESGQGGLEVCVSVQGSRRGQGMCTTDAEGNATLERRSTEAIRIDLVDRNGYVMGSTDTYQRYPTGLETLVLIPARSGTLALRLPAGVEVKHGEKYQFHLTRTSSPYLDLIVKSITKDSPRRRRGVRSSVGGVEFEALRPGEYSIKAERRIIQDGGVLSTPTGGWLHGTAQVFPGQVTTCTLH